MSVLIVSAGRSGSGWLTTTLAATGLSAVHEWTGSGEASPDVISDTSWLWCQDEFLKDLRVEDSIIVLDRSAAQRHKSVEKLLGKRDWSALEAQWDSFKDKLRLLGGDVTWVDYDELFTPTGKQKVFHHLWYFTGHATDKFDQTWNFMRHMNICNKRAETDVKASYGIEE